VSKFLLILLTW